MIEPRMPRAPATATLWAFLSLLLLAPTACAQAPAPAGAPAKPAAEATSSFAYDVIDDQQTISITNVTYQALDPYIPGRKETQRLVLRTTTRSKSVVDEIGVEGSVTVDAWPLGTRLDRPPLYSVKQEGVEVAVMNQSVLVFDRAVEDVQWWSVYSLDKGRHLFDTYMPVTEFSISREYDTPRFVGFEAPPDEAPDPRLNEPHVVGVLTYASAERVIREALVTCDDPDRAAVYRSYADEMRELVLQVGPVPPAKGKEYPEPARTLISPSAKPSPRRPIRSRRSFQWRATTSISPMPGCPPAFMPPPGSADHTPSNCRNPSPYQRGPTTRPPRDRRPAAVAVIGSAPPPSAPAPCGLKWRQVDDRSRPA